MCGQDDCYFGYQWLELLVCFVRTRRHLKVIWTSPACVPFTLSVKLQSRTCVEWWSAGRVQLLTPTLLQMDAQLNWMALRSSVVAIYWVAQKLTPFLYALTLPNINRFSNPAVFTSYVQCVHLAAGRRSQSGDTTDQWCNQWNADISQGSVATHLRRGGRWDL